MLFALSNNRCARARALNCARVGERCVAVHLLEPVELPALLEQSNPALVPKIMEVQVDHPELGAPLGGEGVLFPVRLHLGT